MGNCIKQPRSDSALLNPGIIQADPKVFAPIDISLENSNHITPGDYFEQPPGIRRLWGKAQQNIQRNLENEDAPTAIVTHQAKSLKEREEIKRALNSHFVFNGLPAEDLETIIDEMLHYSLGSKEVIFHQGKPGNNFFVIATGKVEIIVNGKTRGYIYKGHGFGELALMHDSERTATIRTVEKTTLWGIDRQKFSSAVKTINGCKYLENKAFIESVRLFDDLSEQQKEQILSLLVSQEFTNGQKIIVEGDPGDLFYIVKEGEVRCSIRGIDIRQIGKGEFFGEQAILYNTDRTATVTAVGNTHVFSLGKEHLVSLIGDQLQIIYRNSIRISLENSSVLKCLSKMQVDQIIDSMEIVTYQAGDIVVSADAPKGERLWAIIKGTVATHQQEFSRFKCIGDQDLYHPSGGRVGENYVATMECDVAEIGREFLEQCLGGPLRNISSTNEVVDVLKKVQLLRPLPHQTIERLVKALKLHEFEDKQVIFTQNDPGDTFYIVKEGQVDIIKDHAIIRTIGKHDYFGERSILLNENRTATVITQGRVTLWVLSREDFLHFIEHGIRAQLLKRIDLQDDTVTLSELRFVKVLGKGMFGNVLLTVHRQKNIPYALKIVQRSKISAYDIYENLVLERQLLLQLDHPFILKLVKTFKDENRLYYLTELVRGMDLFDVLRVLNVLSNESSKFYAGCLMLILEHLHERQIIYRDLKPENIMIDDEGYPKLIDFGTAKILQGRTYTVVGTPHYMAPEVIVSKGYNLSADYWSLGIMIYEFVCGCLPFGEEEEDTYRVYEKVLERRLAYPSYMNPSFRAKPMIEQLLSSNPVMRGNFKSIMQHSWFAGLDWDKLLGKQFRPPFIPAVGSLATEINACGKKEVSIFTVLEKEEGRDSADVPRHKIKPPPEGWDCDF